MEFWQNKIPITAVIYEILVALIMVSMTILLFLRYRARKKEAVLYMLLAYSSFSLSIILAMTGRILGYFSSIDYLEKSYTDPTSLIAYAFMALGNCFVIYFVDAIFLNKGKNFVFPWLIINGITIGLIIPNINFVFGTFNALFGVLVYHAIVTFLVFGQLSYFSFKESALNEEKLTKIGFRYIGLYGVFMMLIFVFFAFDGILRDSFDIFWRGYTPAYYFAWICTIIASFFGYLGLFMPKWFVQRFIKQ